MTKNYLALFILTFIIASCGKEDTTPSWLVIDDIALQTDEVTQGENSESITDAWVYMDNQAIGVFELPAKIPILAEGEHDFTIYAGIKINGISATRGRYPFYTRFDSTITLIKDQEVHITPTVSYKSDIQFQLLEDFEDVGIDFGKAAISDTSMITIDKSNYPNIVKYGNYCGGVFLNETDSLFKGVTSTDLNLPQGEDVYMEMDFMNTNSMVMGMVAENAGGSQEQPPLVGINMQEESEMVWKKIYIDLHENVSFEVNATSFEIYLLSILDESNTNGVVYLDNIKVLRFD